MKKHRTFNEAMNDLHTAWIEFIRVLLEHRPGIYIVGLVVVLSRVLLKIFDRFL